MRIGDCSTIVLPTHQSADSPRTYHAAAVHITVDDAAGVIPHKPTNTAHARYYNASCDMAIGDSAAAIIISHQPADLPSVECSHRATAYIAAADLAFVIPH